MRSSSTKQCPDCGTVRSRADFVDLNGDRTPRGKYCCDCHARHEMEFRQERRRLRDQQVDEIKKKHGDNWMHFCPYGLFDEEIYAERTECLYCGAKLPPPYVPRKIEPRPFVGRAHFDHMDPLEREGEDSIRNVVCVCSECNLQKGDMAFCTWLERLPPDRRDLARAVYIQKHGHTPEEFRPLRRHSVITVSLKASVNENGKPTWTSTSSIEPPEIA